MCGRKGTFGPDAHFHVNLNRCLLLDLTWKTELLYVYWWCVHVCVSYVLKQRAVNGERKRLKTCDALTQVKLQAKENAHTISQAT